MKKVLNQNFRNESLQSLQSLRYRPLQAVILNCAHSFCSYCINQWRKKKNECPICRQAIQSQTRCLALDNCIDSMVENLSLDMKARRKTLITQRKGERCVSSKVTFQSMVDLVSFCLTGAHTALPESLL